MIMSFQVLPIMNADGPVDVYRYIPPPPPPIMKEVIPPRHRRKKREDENSTTTQPVQTQTKDMTTSRGTEFDLVEEAFPPLPG